MTHDELERLATHMRGCFKFDGPYTLSSGRTSQYYYDGKGATQDPEAAWLIGNALMDMVLDSGAEAVGGLEIGAVPIASAVSLAAYADRGVRLPTFIVRKQAKGHGTTLNVSEANMPDRSRLLSPGRRVAVVDDVITTGGSIQQAVDAVRALGCTVTIAVAIVERHESETEARGLFEQGFPVRRLFYTDEQGNLFPDDDVLRAAGSPAGAGLPSG
jgi:orotate phosphoribosyltransferase